VQEYNKRLLTTYIANGLSKYPGCTEIVKRNTGRIRGVSDALDIELEPGDILYRDMIDGDPTNFNRQPSLKSSNISGMKMVVCEDPNVLTLRMNVISCPLFDADFDGDYYGSQKYICLRMC
jgi:DNA-directed RNA polymerase beta' subunit